MKFKANTKLQRKKLNWLVRELDEENLKRFFPIATVRARIILEVCSAKSSSQFDWLAFNTMFKETVQFGENYETRN